MAGVPKALFARNNDDEVPKASLALIDGGVLKASLEPNYGGRAEGITRAEC